MYGDITYERLLMKGISASLTDGDRKKRDFVLYGNMWRVVLYVCAPLAAYQGFSQIFTILDSVMAAHISSAAVSAVAYISQINLVISSLGTGLSIGAGIKISEAFGAGDYVLAKKRVSTVYAVCFAAGLLILALILPFGRDFLLLSGTPQSLINEGQAYFTVSLISTVLQFINTMYISVERARGSSGKILVINATVIIIKFALTAFFIYVLGGTVVYIAAATLISQMVFFILALINMNIGSDNVFGFSPRAVSLEKSCVMPVIKTSVPVIAEKAAFFYGKLVINAMSTSYGDTVVGALGISNNLGGIATSLQNGFQDGGSAIISQNIGSGQISRALDAFRKILIINMLIGAAFLSLTLGFIEPLCSLFAGSDTEFHEMIRGIYSYEALGAVTLGINAAAMALLYGFGYTKLTLVLNAARVFIFRIPVLWYMQTFTAIGSSAVGLVMMISNISVGLCSAAAAFFTVRAIKKKYGIKK